MSSTPPPNQQSRSALLRSIWAADPPPAVLHQPQLLAEVQAALESLRRVEARVENAERILAGMLAGDRRYNLGAAANGNGLSEEIIVKNMKTRTVIKLDHDDEDDIEVCVVCQDCLYDRELKEENIAAILDNCGHMFHVGCMKKWLVEKNTCPICKVIGLNVD